MADNDVLRQRAEALAREKADSSPENLEARMRPEEVRHALHELRVHQIELEMQNEELRRTQLELEAARARYFDLYDLAPVGYVTVSEQGLILEANLTAATLLGVSRGALGQQPIFSRFIFKEDQDLYYRHRKHLLETGEPQAFELRLVKNDGTPFWAQLAATAAQNAAGAPVCHIVLSDITARKQAEEALRENEEKYRVLFNNEIYAICIFDLETLKLLDANEAYAHLYGYSREELVSGMTIHDITAEHQASDAATTQATREGTTYIPLRYHRKKDGTIFPVEIVGGPYVWQGRKVMFALAHDITDRQQADEELRLFKAIIEGSEEALAISDSGGKLIYINPAHQRLFGRTLEQARQTNYRDYYPPESIEILDQVVAPALARGESWTGELDVFDAAGRRFPLWERANGLTDVDGTLLYGFGFMHDITDRKQAEAALRELNAELQTRNEELDAFAHTVAHNLKNSLGVMMGYADLLAEDYSVLLPDKAQQALMTISRSGQKAANIIESLFLLASVRQQDVQVAPLDMARIIKEALLRLTDSIQDSGADIRVPDCAGWPVALSHAPWIEEIWVNYLSNAIKYGCPQPRIDLDAARLPPLSATARERGQGGGFIRFSVRDYGPGLTPEQQERLFMPFERLGQTQIEGHGLGLSVVRRIANKLGGQVGVDSQPGHGSTFYFTLPAAPDLCQ